jgi:hypothetical protein
MPRVPAQDAVRAFGTGLDREMEREREYAMAEPAIDFDRAGGVDLDRLERSLGLRGERVEQGRYRVTGGSQDHWVDLYTAAYPRCDCGDHLWRDRICKHILAALLREGDERVVRALQGLIERLRDRSREVARAA